MGIYPDQFETKADPHSFRQEIISLPQELYGPAFLRSEVALKWRAQPQK